MKAKEIKPPTEVYTIWVEQPTLTGCLLWTRHQARNWIKKWVLCPLAGKSFSFESFESHLFLLVKICKIHRHLPVLSFDRKRKLGTWFCFVWLPNGVPSSFLNYLALSKPLLPKSEWLNIWNEAQQNSDCTLKSLCFR